MNTRLFRFFRLLAIFVVFLFIGLFTALGLRATMQEPEADRPRTGGELGHGS